MTYTHTHSDIHTHTHMLLVDNVKSMDSHLPDQTNMLSPNYKNFEMDIARQGHYTHLRDFYGYVVPM